eukprot:CAMPEP_0202707106 /NCGR_PEP_ID=MMETSP1385-20130828/19445_1 /ASSEMBLY_ACC=CAM_ASM_000861 /TAXON_ID=933848 /ORGANISM="Elphidium margaritaceum" /LENGTH=105 /DNA_ID=CAMNT_0049365735 /DNA_START=432 /DNA_END=749 /DNA_ORIENTATION=-
MRRKTDQRHENRERVIGLLFLENGRMIPQLSLHVMLKADNRFRHIQKIRNQTIDTAQILTKDTPNGALMNHNTANFLRHFLMQCKLDHAIILRQVEIVKRNLSVR